MDQSTGIGTLVVAWLRLVRVPLVVLTVVATLALEKISGKLGTIDGTLIFFTILFANLAFNILNDVMDEASDGILKPWKPIPSKQINPDTAVQVAGFFGTIALGCLILLVNPVYYALGFLGILAGITYNLLHERGLIGNAALGVSYFVCSYMASYPHYFWFAVGFALLVTGYNIAVQIQDMEGDAVVGWKTFPVICGRSVSRIVSAAMVMMGWMFIVNDINNYGIPFICAAAMVWAAVVLDYDESYELMLRYGARLFIILGFVILLLFYP